MEVVLSILIITVIVLGYIVYNLYTKNTLYEQVAVQNDEDLEALTNYLLDLKQIVENMQERITDLDAKGSFESDDEVGFFFQEIKQMTQDLNEFTGQIQDEQDGN